MHSGVAEAHAVGGVGAHVAGARALIRRNIKGARAAHSNHNGEENEWHNKTTSRSIGDPTHIDVISFIFFMVTTLL